MIDNAPSLGHRQNGLANVPVGCDGVGSQVVHNDEGIGEHSSGQRREQQQGCLPDALHTPQDLVATLCVDWRLDAELHCHDQQGTDLLGRVQGRQLQVSFSAKAPQLSGKLFKAGFGTRVFVQEGLAQGGQPGEEVGVDEEVGVGGGLGVSVWEDTASAAGWRTSCARRLMNRCRPRRLPSRSRETVGTENILK